MDKKNINSDKVIEGIIKKKFEIDDTFSELFLTLIKGKGASSALEKLSKEPYQVEGINKGNSEHIVQDLKEPVKKILTDKFNRIPAPMRPPAIFLNHLLDPESIKSALQRYLEACMEEEEEEREEKEEKEKEHEEKESPSFHKTDDLIGFLLPPKITTKYISTIVDHGSITPLEDHDYPYLLKTSLDPFKKVSSSVAKEILENMPKTTTEKDIKAFEAKFLGDAHWGLPYLIKLGVTFGGYGRFKFTLKDGQTLALLVFGEKIKIETKSSHAETMMVKQVEALLHKGDLCQHIKAVDIFFCILGKENKAFYEAPLIEMMKEIITIQLKENDHISLTQFSHEINDINTHLKEGKYSTLKHEDKNKLVEGILKKIEFKGISGIVKSCFHEPSNKK